MEQKEKGRELEFTGNWFIDAGILGFVNLMEEVYGWDLDETQRRIKERPEEVYYGWFPLAYVLFNKKESGEEIDFRDYIPENDFFKDKSGSEVFEISWDLISKKFSEKIKGNKERVSFSSKNRFYYFHNFLFFQKGSIIDKQKKDFSELLSISKVTEEVLSKVDKTLNKFLPSRKELLNVPYTDEFVPIRENNLIFILTFPLSFLPIRREKSYDFFYVPNERVSYEINKKIKFLLRKRNEKSSFIGITWKAIFDFHLETKSLWSLENMYIIRYGLGKNQVLFDVEYMGIPKLQASILLDDQIRGTLNNSIKFRKMGDKQYSRLLEDFIKGNSLFEYVLGHSLLKINGEKKFNPYLSVYSLIIDAKIKEISGSQNLFSDDFFKDYGNLSREIKKEFQIVYHNSHMMKNTFQDGDKEEKLGRELITSLNNNNKNQFLNILLKNLNNSDSKNNINQHIFTKIINNDLTWQNYALALIVGLIK